MSIFDVLTLIGGLCLFLFGMDVMGKSLERSAGSKLRDILGKFTTNKIAGFLTGIAVTSVIQSSSATTVMVVGFVNSGLMNLSQATNVILGANLGTSVTAWILSLSGIEGESFILKMLKPSSFTPILALIGIGLYMFTKVQRKRDIGTILLGFATLMFGMETMSDAVEGLAGNPGFQSVLTMFTNPILGMLAGVVLTAIIQSSSASVGILQALSVTGEVSFGAAIPIIMGQNIGTCITAILSSFGANKNAKRAALVHLSFNVLGTVVWLTVFCILKAIFNPAILGDASSPFSIAVCHSAFKILCLILFLPLSSVLEKIANKLIPDDKKPETIVELDDRLLETPPIALQRCKDITNDMAVCSIQALREAIAVIRDYSKEKADEIRGLEEKSDHYEDILGSYLVKLSSKPLSADDNLESAMMLKAIGDFERISDHSVNILESIEEMREKKIVFSHQAKKEFVVLMAATEEILDKTLDAYVERNLDAVAAVEPLEQVIDRLKDILRVNHIRRLQQNDCSIETGFIWNDLITDFERVSDHCSNIAGGILDREQHTMNIHESLREIKASDAHFKEAYVGYMAKYAIENIN
ncbi:MAG: Na/Pi cotransporter family protein [Clostridia bacterium]|nr:Na/Pi cotransporter family protein [Clostridia bacterium]